MTLHFKSRKQKVQLLTQETDVGSIDLKTFVMFYIERTVNLTKNSYILGI